MKEAVSSITSDQMLVSQIADALSPFGTYSQEGALGILVQLCSAAKSFSSDSEVLLLTKLSTLTTMKLLFYGKKKKNMKKRRGVQLIDD